jgi:hypothetical protein
MDLLENVDALLIKYFLTRPFNLEGSLKLLALWHEFEGAPRGETPEILIEELGEEIFEGPPNEEFLNNSRALLKEFHRRKSESGRG